MLYHESNITNTALSMGHKSLASQGAYLHAIDEGLSSIITPSQAVLDEYKKGVVDKQNKRETALELIKALKEDKELMSVLKELLKDS